MNCRSCGKPFVRANVGDTNTQCPPCRRPHRPMPLEHVRYTPPGLDEPVVLDDGFWERWERNNQGEKQ